MKKPLAEELLFGRLVKGGLVRFGVVEGKLVFDIDDEPVAEKPIKKPPSKRGRGDSDGASKVPERVE